MTVKSGRPQERAGGSPISSGRARASSSNSARSGQSQTTISIKPEHKDAAAALQPMLMHLRSLASTQLLGLSEQGVGMDRG